MIACRTNRFAGLGLALLVGFAAPLHAEPAATGAPQTLPGVEPAPAPSGDSAPTEFKPGSDSKPDQSGITTTDLGIVDGPPVGTLDDGAGGLGQSMWVNASRGEIEELLARLPLVSADPFVRSLARRVVLTVSDAPVGPAKRALVTIRIEKLLQAGMVDEAGTIAAQLQLNGDADFVRVQADALLYAGLDKDVCSPLTATRLVSAELFWLQLRTWCFAASGDEAAADLTRAVLDAQGAGDAAFDTLLSDIRLAKKTQPGDISHPTAMHLYLMHKAGLAVSNSLAAKLGTIANAFAARDARNAPADRLAAATRISQTGALTPAELVAILDAQAISSKEIANAGELAVKLPFLPAQSLLRRAAELESRLGAKASLLAAALAADGHPDRLPLTAILEGSVAASIKPDAVLNAQRYLIARALLLSGRADAAEGWYRGSAHDTEFNLFQVLADLAAPNAGRDAAAQAALTAFGAESAATQKPTIPIVLALGLSDVLGKPMPPNAKSLAASLEGIHWPGTTRSVSSDEIRKLEEAASQPGRRGEVVLRVLDIVGPSGPFDLPADVVIECVRILQQAGLGDDAHALAIEALALQPLSP